MAKQNSSRTSLATRQNGMATESKPASLLAEYSALRYDYNRVSNKHRRAVQDAAVDIRRKQRRAVEDMLAIGRRLMEVKDYLPHGEFEKWIKIEFEISLGSASEYRNMALRFEGKPSIIEGLTPTTARLLAAPSVPDEVITAVMDAVRTEGKALLVREVKAIRDAYMVPKEPKQLTGPATSRDEADPVVDAEYTVVPAHEFIFPAPKPDANLVYIGVSRELAAKLRDGLFHRLFKSFFSGSESDALVVALTRALEDNQTSKGTTL